MDKCFAIIYLGHSRMHAVNKEGYPIVPDKGNMVAHGRYRKCINIFRAVKEYFQMADVCLFCNNESYESKRMREGDNYLLWNYN